MNFQAGLLHPVHKFNPLDIVISSSPKKKSVLKLSTGSGLLEAGCDEAGRGCLAGPVYAAAVILPDDFYHPLLNDSKQVTEAARNELRLFIEANALAWAVAMVDHKEIDRINILKASFKAMHKAVKALTTKPAHLLIDGNRFAPYRGISHQCIVKGDALFAPIAAASILAKTHRDAFMLELHPKYPHYGWDENKGYGTLKHRMGIVGHGLSKYHRKTFSMGTNQLMPEPDAVV